MKALEISNAKIARLLQSSRSIYIDRMPVKGTTASDIDLNVLKVSISEIRETIRGSWCRSGKIPGKPGFIKVRTVNPCRTAPILRKTQYNQALVSYTMCSC
jgi:hypothetical protein